MWAHVHWEGVDGTTALTCRPETQGRASTEKTLVHDEQGYIKQLKVEFCW